MKPKGFMDRRKGLETDEHYSACVFLANKYCGYLPVREIGKDFVPDVITESKLIEVETIFTKSYLDKNKPFWKDNKIKLYLIIPKEIEDHIEEIIFLKSNFEEIKLK